MPKRRGSISARSQKRSRLAYGATGAAGLLAGLAGGAYLTHRQAQKTLAEHTAALDKARKNHAANLQAADDNLTKRSADLVKAHGDLQAARANIATRNTNLGLARNVIAARNRNLAQARADMSTLDTMYQRRVTAHRALEAELERTRDQLASTSAQVATAATARNKVMQFVLSGRFMSMVTAMVVLFGLWKWMGTQTILKRADLKPGGAVVAGPLGKAMQDEFMREVKLKFQEARANLPELVGSATAAVGSMLDNLPAIVASPPAQVARYLKAGAKHLGLPTPTLSGLNAGYTYVYNLAKTVQGPTRLPPEEQATLQEHVVRLTTLSLQDCWDATQNLSPAEFARRFDLLCGPIMDTVRQTLSTEPDKLALLEEVPLRGEAGKILVEAGGGLVTFYNDLRRACVFLLPVLALVVGNHLLTGQPILVSLKSLAGAVGSMLNWSNQQLRKYHVPRTGTYLSGLPGRNDSSSEEDHGQPLPAPPAPLRRRTRRTEAQLTREAANAFMRRGIR